MHPEHRPIASWMSPQARPAHGVRALVNLLTAKSFGGWDGDGVASG
jgi:hypothetical protein